MRYSSWMGPEKTHEVHLMSNQYHPHMKRNIVKLMSGPTKDPWGTPNVKLSSSYKLKSLNNLFIVVSFMFLSLCRRKTIQVYVGRLRMEVCKIRWTNTPLQKAHRSQTIQMYSLRAMLLAIRPSRPSHEAPSLTTWGQSWYCTATQLDASSLELPTFYQINSASWE